MNQDFQDLLRELSAANAKFLVVGGIRYGGPWCTTRDG